MKYTMYKYNANTKHWDIYTEFADKTELIHFLAYGTNTHDNAPRHRWTNKYFDGQNLTGKDVVVSHSWTFLRDENGNVRRNEYGPLYEQRIHRDIREWHLEDEDDRAIDMRLFQDDVFDLVAQMGDYERHYLYLRRWPSKKRRQRQGRPYRHSFHYRCTQNNHRYSRTLKTHDELDDDIEMILTSHQAQSVKVKPKDMYAKFACGDDFWRSGPAGWKEHKNSKQWEAKQKRTDAVWVSYEDKRNMDDEPELVHDENEFALV